MLKVFEKDGTNKIRLPKNDDKRIQGWLALNGSTIEDAGQYATEVHDSTLNQTVLVFPCEVREVSND